MPELFKLEAKSVATNEKALPDTEGGNAKLTIEPGKVMFSILSGDGLKPSKAKLNLQDGPQGPRNFPFSQNEIQPLPLDLSSESASGDYVAFVAYKPSDSAEEAEVQTEAVSITVKPKSKLSDPNEDAGDRVRETSIGGYDNIFTYVLLAIVVVACVAVSWAAWSVILRIPLPNSPITDEKLFGTWAERTAAITILVALAGGLVVLLLGSWLAGLETRGRLHLKVPVTGNGGPRGEISDSLKALAEVLEKLKTVRGSIAVLFVGAVVVGSACWAAASIATQGNAPSPAGGSASPTPQAPSNAASPGPTGR
ncbi:hypothetical protein QFZ35_001883 [Arthrobacter ulcerisalmonis]|nr:hypothetical protein [Arthrobacter ulcerisalmonis]MDQ0663385.1 hypothetical protein [Arthrobacter ulcerisalmonis]